MDAGGRALAGMVAGAVMVLAGTVFTVLSSLGRPPFWFGLLFGLGAVLNGVRFARTGYRAWNQIDEG